MHKLIVFYKIQKSCKKQRAAKEDKLFHMKKYSIKLLKCQKGNINAFEDKFVSLQYYKIRKKSTRNA